TASSRTIISWASIRAWGPSLAISMSETRTMTMVKYDPRQCLSLTEVSGQTSSSKQAVYRRAKGSAMPQSAEDAVAAVEQGRIDALLTADINTMDEIIDEQCTHIESNGTARTKAAFLEEVAKREFSFDLFEIEENYIRIFGETAVVAGTYRNIVRVR